MNSCELHDNCIVVYDCMYCPMCNLNDELEALQYEIMILEARDE